MSENEPILVALALDADSADVLVAAREIALRMERPLLVVHAIRALPGEPVVRIERWVRDAREQIDALSFGFEELGVRMRDPIVRADRPVDLVMETARSEDAHLIVTGGGTPPTVRRWLLGSTAENIVRASPIPVLVFRGTLPGPGRPVLCPASDSRRARLGLAAGVRMARLFDAPLSVLRVITAESRGWIDAEALDHELARAIGPERESVEALLDTVDVGVVHTDVNVMVGPLAARIVEASESAGLLVLASGRFDQLAPGALPTAAERGLRFSRISALCVPDHEPVDGAIEMAIREVTDLKRRGDALVADGRAERALPFLRAAAMRSPANAAIHESLAAALHAMGRAEEAGAWLALARETRTSFA